MSSGDKTGGVYTYFMSGWLHFRRIAANSWLPALVAVISFRPVLTLLQQTRDQLLAETSIADECAWMSWVSRFRDLAARFPDSDYVTDVPFNLIGSPPSAASLLALSTSTAEGAGERSPIYSLTAAARMLGSAENLLSLVQALFAEKRIVLWSPDVAGEPLARVQARESQMLSVGQTLADLMYPFVIDPTHSIITGTNRLRSLGSPWPYVMYIPESVASLDDLRAARRREIEDAIKYTDPPIPFVLVEMRPPEQQLDDCTLWTTAIHWFPHESGETDGPFEGAHFSAGVQVCAATAVFSSPSGSKLEPPSQRTDFALRTAMYAYWEGLLSAELLESQSPVSLTGLVHVCHVVVGRCLFSS